MRHVLSAAVVLAIAAPALAADSNPVTFSKDVAPILQKKCQECHQPGSIAPMSLITYQEARPWAKSIRERVAARQMPPWHIDHSVGVQKFKNDMSLSDDQIDTIVDVGRRGCAAGRSEGHAAADATRRPTTSWKASAGWLRTAGPGHQVAGSTRCRRSTRTSGSARLSEIPLNEPRWVKMVEIRPTNLAGRKIIHHSIAYLVLNNDPDAVSTGTANGPERPGGNNPADLVNRRPQLMEWAIGKGYDLYRPGTGKLLVPGEKISWDQHIHAVGEEITVGIRARRSGSTRKARSRRSAPT